MGCLKDALIDPEGFKPRPDRFVAVECFEDPALQRLVAANVQSRICSYSGRRGRNPIAAPLDVVVGHILTSLERHYEDAANGVGWEDGEYVGNMTLDTYDLIGETVSFGEQAGELLSDIADALPQRVWSRIDPYGPRERDVLSWSWVSFTETVKHIRRYFFEQQLEPADWRDEKVSPSRLLGEVLSSCDAAGLVRALPAGQRYFRCRTRGKGERFTEPLDLGPPPPPAAKQSRMSPAGIPVFYGAYDKATAEAETLNDGQRYAMAEFRTTRPIRVLDLTATLHVSIFDPNLGHLSDWAYFMTEFVDNFRRPVADDGAQHIEYVPTQIVTEFIRSWRRKGGLIDGVAYNSVKNRGGRCVVLFADRSEVEPTVDRSETPAGSRLLAMRRVKNHRRYEPKDIHLTAGTLSGR